MSDHTPELDLSFTDTAECSDSHLAPLPCSIRVVGMLNKDYLFLISEEAISLQQGMTEILPYLADDLLLEQETIEVITVHPDSLGNKRYRRFEICWYETGPKLVSPSVTTSETIPYLETLLQHSVCLD